MLWSGSVEGMANYTKLLAMFGEIKTRLRPFKCTVKWYSGFVYLLELQSLAPSHFSSYNEIKVSPVNTV